MRLNKKTDAAIQGVVEKYGDLLYDVCHSVLWSHSNAQVAFREIIKTIKATPANERFEKYQRAWILRISYEVLSKYSSKYARTQTPAERMMLDATKDLNLRIAQFDSFFHRLTMDEQYILLLRDKHGISDQELGAIMNLPEGSVKLRREQALRTLEDWIWQ